MTETFEEFSRIALEKFGDKIKITELTASQETLDAVNKTYGSQITLDDVNNYGKHAWLMENKCPNCNSDLLGLFGSFQWGIIHGIGYCKSCEDVELRYYHYIRDCKKPLLGFSLVGFK